MGSCRYCGRGVGWFHTSHPGCRDARRSGLARMVDQATQAAERPEFAQRRVLQLLWLFDDAEYRLGRLAADRAATITGVAAAGWTLPYYPPQLFVGRETPGDGWETVATGRMALTSHGVAYDGNGVGHRETAGQFVGAGMDLHNICTKTAQ